MYNRNSIKKVGSLYGKPLVAGEERQVKDNEILVKEEGRFVTLAKRNKGELKSLSDFSSTEERFYNIEAVVYSRLVDYKVTYNPATLEELFANAPCLSYDSATKEVKRVDIGYYSSSEEVEGSNVYFARLVLWLNRQVGKDTIERYLKQSIVSHLSGHAYSMNYLYISEGGIALKDGHFMGILASSDSDTFTLRNYSQWKSSTENIICTNCKGEEIEDSFSVLGDSKTFTTAIDESYVVAAYPKLFISPLVNGMFVLGTFKGTTDLVLMNCLEIDTKCLREQLGIPESMVIPCKEGEYIKYPNIEEPSLARSIARGDDDEFTQKLIDHLQSMINSLKGETSTTEDTATETTTETSTTEESSKESEEESTKE